MSDATIHKSLLILEELRRGNPGILITIENPEHSVFALHPTVRQFTATGNRRLLYSSHCATADPVLDGRVTGHLYSPGLFPQKHTLWLTTSMPRGANLSRCSNNCLMRVNQHPTAHRLVICRPASRTLLPGQRVMTMQEKRARIPLGAMQQIWTQHLQLKHNTDQSDAHCAKCGGNHNPDDNQLLICDGPSCGRVAHLRCSGFSSLENTPQTWLCESCALRGDRTQTDTMKQ